jgi:hypothetical protein
MALWIARCASIQRLRVESQACAIQHLPVDSENLQVKSVGPKSPPAGRSAGEERFRIKKNFPLSRMIEIVGIFSDAELKTPYSLQGRRPIVN